MKRFVCLFALATLSVAVSAHGQSSADQAVSEFGSIHRPTPKPGDSPVPSTKPSGPPEAGLFKDAKGKSATTTFAPTDTIYVVGKNILAKKGDKAGVNWYGKGDKKLTANDVTLPNDGVYGPSFHLSPPAKGTPAGSYRADFVQNGKVIKSLPFTVK